ncbi:MAG: quinol:cytochrome C oxidoreductase [Bacteroidetes bacterium]|nr:quinol:cytochrome C oxidoreductase [Bacteroidota bacterium]
MFLISVGLGSLFLVALEYIGGAVWSTPFRRITEFFAAVLFILPFFIIPVYFNIHDMFHWTHVEEVLKDKILSGKSAYLNEGFFTIRIVLFFAIWIFFYLILTRNSKKQDTTLDQSLTKKNIKISAIFMPFFGITLTLASIDWIMSLEPHWFSTIFGIYYFSGTILTALAVTTFMVVYLNEKGLLVKGLKRDHYYSLGALLFAFINFWAYIAFSQFLLIYYANLPEETYWFIARTEGSWVFVTILLGVVHFLVPYIGLLSQPSKMNPKRLKFMAVWILCAHLLDMYWLIMPTFSKDGAAFGWMELGYPLLAFGTIILVFYYFAKNKDLIPVGDPKLKRGIDFRL